MASTQQPNKAHQTNLGSAEGSRHFSVLVIDDNEADQNLTSIYLNKAWPFERDLVLDYAADGVEALEKLRRGQFAVVVLDWKLPLMDGGEVLRNFRQTGMRTPVVVVSGLQREDITEDLEALGAAFLCKDEMNADTFRTKIAHSLRLLGFVRPPNSGTANQPGAIHPDLGQV